MDLETEDINCCNFIYSGDSYNLPSPDFSLSNSPFYDSMISPSTASRPPDLHIGPFSVVSEPLTMLAELPL